MGILWKATFATWPSKSESVQTHSTQLLFLLKSAGLWLSIPHLLFYWRPTEPTYPEKPLTLFLTHWHQKKKKKNVSRLRLMLETSSKFPKAHRVFPTMIPMMGPHGGLQIQDFKNGPHLKQYIYIYISPSLPHRVGRIRWDDACRMPGTRSRRKEALVSEAVIPIRNHRSRESAHSPLNIACTRFEELPLVLLGGITLPLVFLTGDLPISESS